jgi:hypothetical protein
LPASVVGRAYLTTLLKEHQVKLKTLNLELAIPIIEIHKYYTAPITTCQYAHDSGRIYIKIQLPTMRSNIDY